MLWTLTLATVSMALQVVSSSFVGPSFLKEPPSRVEFANDTGSRVDCSAGGSPPATISWLAVDGKPITEIPATRELLANGSLLFLPFHPSAYRHDVHAATYRCVAANSVGRIFSRDIRVRAVVLQKYEVQVYYNKNVVRGNTAVLKCTIPSFVREYITVTSWLQDSSFNIYPSIKGDGKYHMLPSGELLIRRVDESDKYRSYQCRAVNRLTGATLLSVGRARFTVTDSRITEAPRPLDKQVSLSTKKDQAVVLPCFAEGNPPPSFRWFRQDRHQLRVVAEDVRVFAVADCLVILHADDVDAGKWVCVANNTAGVERLDINLHVTSPLSVAIQPSGQVTVDVGSKAELLCLVSGPPPQVPTWLKDGHVIPGSEKLVLEKVQREDAGMYQCIVRGEEDSAQSSIQLRLGAAHPKLLYKFIRQTLQPGPPVSLKCIATGNPTPQITWRLDGFALPQNERFVIGQYVTLLGDVISHVNISNVQVEDGGIYQCTASNRVGEDSHSADMRVYGLPFIRAMPNVSAVAGEPLYIACPVAGYPIDSITWEKDGRALPLNRRQQVFQNGTLLLENVQRDPDRGEYRCSATNKQGRSATQILPLNVIVPPRIAPFTFQTDLHLGDRAGVQCFITKGDLPLTIEWKKDGAGLESDVGVRQLGDFVSSLSIESLLPHHAGIYTCLASNSAAHSTHSSTLLVNVPPRIGPFTFGELIEGVRTQVQCVIQAGDPPLSMKWLKDDASLPLELGIHVTQDDYSTTLSIPRVGRSHSGNYTCLAGNLAKSASITAPLVVSVPPRWVSEPRDRNVTRDEPAAFHCQADGFPTPTLVWRKVISRQPSEYQDLSVRSRGIQLFSNGTFFIRQALPEHQGQYLCEATNSIGAGLSVVVTLTVHVPPEFEVKSAQASVRRSAAETLECRVMGDAPMSIVWQRDGPRQSEQLNPRYEVKESVVKGGFLSELHIASTVKSDSGTFTCVARNPYGRAERTVHLQVQDAPGKAQDVRVLDSGSRTVKLTWLAPSDERSPVLQYIVQFQLESGALAEGWQNAPAGTETVSVVTGLLPASLYRLRVVGENELGAGEPSEVILVRTEGEAPAGEPQNMVVTATSSEELRVTWSAPLQHLWNGDILGYYVGYRQHGLGRLGGYNFTTVPAKNGNTGLATLSKLKKFRKYGIVVQAFNEKGPGPMSTETVAQTLEDVPSGTPLDIRCTSQSSQSLSVSWQPPPQLLQNGVIQGYKVYYENMDEWPPGHIEAETKMTADLSTELHGVQKYSNYSIQVWAFTHVGDGAKSVAIFCMTDEDVPEAPSNIKVLALSPTALVVSWTGPSRPNGRLISYTVYSRVLEAGRERDSAKRRLPPTHTNYEVHDLHKGEAYEFWVTGFTRVGEGQSTQVVYATISNRVPAAIISFGQVVRVGRRGSVHLPCLAAGLPQPERVWLSAEGPLVSGDSISIQADGTLQLTDVQRHHQANYTCSVSNPNGSDQIVYSVFVVVSPSAPAVRVAATSSDWLQVQWAPVESGGSAVRGFLLNFRQEEAGEWEERAISRDSSFFRLAGLSCGTEYQLQLVAYNSIGSGPPSQTLIARTDGAKPGKPSNNELVEVNSTCISLHLNSWTENGCPITSFSIEYRESSHHEWLTVGNNVQNKDILSIVGLWPGTQYIVRVSASNSAGSNTAEYSALTPALLGGTLSPDQEQLDLDQSAPFYLDLGFILPSIISLMALISVIAGVCICLRRKSSREHGGRCTLQSDPQAMVALDNKHNLAQREQYYAAVQKGMATHSVERIPEYAEDISPYATFHVQSHQQVNSPAHIQTFVYHDHRLAAMETMQLKSANPRDDYTRLRGNQKSKCLRSESSDYSGSTEHRSEPLPILNSTRTEHRQSLHNILYPGAGTAGPESSTSPEASPVPDRRNVTRRHRHHVRSKENGTALLFPTRLEPPWGFSDSHELSEAECDMDSIKSRSLKLGHAKRQQNFTIAV